MYLMYPKEGLAPLTESKLYSVNYSDKSDKSASIGTINIFKRKDTETQSFSLRLSAFAFELMT